MTRVRVVMALVAGVLLGTFAGCAFDVNPDQGRFSCTEDADCGQGFECIAQANRKGGLCFAAGTCAGDETSCDGKDEDCNGVVDDVSWAGDACDSTLPGVCRPGTRACEDGNSVCVPGVTASAEACDGLDNDCDDAIDEDFDLARDEQHCGACGNACASGAACSEGKCIEVDCANGEDEDDDGLTDCADPECLALPCSTVEPDRVCGRVPSSWLTDAGVDGGEVPGDAGLGDGGTPRVSDAGSDVGDGGVGDGGSPDAGEELVGACVPRESTCGNLIDDDGDGLVDCEDQDCAGLTCGDAGICSGGTCQ